MNTFLQELVTGKQRLDVHELKCGQVQQKDISGCRSSMEIRGIGPGLFLSAGRDLPANTARRRIPVPIPDARMF